MSAKGYMRADWPYIALISIVMWAAFYNPLNGLPRADHFSYLLDLYKVDSCLDRLSISYSYNRVRFITPGDVLLFRPILFTYLSLTDCFFRTEPVVINAFGVVMHTAIGILFFKIIVRVNELSNVERKIDVRVFAMLSSLFFSLSPLIVEQVAWSHVHGYLISTIFVLVCLYLLLQIYDEGASNGRLVLLCLSAFLASLTYEVNIFLGPLFAYFLITYHPKPNQKQLKIAILVLILMPLIYLGWDIYDYKIVHPPSSIDITSNEVTGQALDFKTFEHCFRWLLFTVVQPLVGYGAINVGSRTFVEEFYNHANTYQLILGLLTVLALLYAAFWVIKYGKKCKKHSSLILFILFWAVVYSGINILGRMNMRPSADILSSNSYYAYVPFLCASFIIAQLSLVLYGLTCEKTFSRKTLFIRFSFAFLIFFVAWRGVEVYKVNSKIGQRNEGLYRYLYAIKKVITFDRFATFRISPEVSIQVPNYQGVPEVEILFSNRIDQCAGSYEIVKYPPYVIPASTLKCYPALIRPGSSYHFYAYDQKVHGVLAWQAPYMPDIVDYAYPIVSNNLQMALRQVQEKLSAQRMDIKLGSFLPPSDRVRLVLEGYKGFNLIAARELVWAIPQGEGDFDYRKVYEDKYSMSFVGANVDIVKQKIDIFRNHGN